MPNTRLPVLEPVPVIEQVRWGVDAIDPWLRAMRPRCASFLPPVCIGLLDTGINLEHVAFSGASIVARSFIGSSDLEDTVGAGTHHAGLLVAQPESGNAGLCPDAILFVAKVCQPGQTFEQLEDATYKALLWLAKVECSLILLPEGSPHNSALIRLGLDALMAQGAVILAGVGEAGGELPLFPAAMRGVLAVSALARDGRPLAGSYAGADVEVWAPGEALISASTQGWSARSGSAAATVIAGGLLVRSLSDYSLRSG